MFYGQLAAAATAAAVVVVACVICAVVAAVAVALILTAEVVVVLLYKKKYENKNQYPCAGVTAEKTIVAAHIVLPPFSDFTIYYAESQEGVKN